MNGSGDLTLACARLADDEHGRRGASGQSHLVEKPGVCWAKSDQPVKPVPSVEPPSEFKQVDMEVVGLRVWRTRLAIRSAHHAQDSDQTAMLILEWPELNAAPDPFAVCMND
jgi:hypothetical protein